MVRRPNIDLNPPDKDQEIGKQSNLSVRSVCSRDEQSVNPKKLFVIGDIG